MQNSTRQTPKSHHSKHLRADLPDFAHIQLGGFVAALKKLIDQYQKGVELWLAEAGAANWSFVESEINWSDAIEKHWSPVSHLNAVADEQKLREAYNEGLELLTHHQTWRQQHRGIYEIYRSIKSSEDYEQMSSDQQRIIELELRDFHLCGVDLDEDGRADYRETVLKLSKLGTLFQENLLDATQAWTKQFDDESALAGLPEAELRMMAENARTRDQDGWVVDLSFPSYFAVLTHAEDRELRKEVYTAYVTRASDQGPTAGQWDNTSIITEILACRHRLAVLLGFDNYVSYALSTRMASHADVVNDFLNGLAKQALPSARLQVETLSAFAAENNADLPLEPWDMSLWAERYRQQELKLSDEQLKPYFPFDSMVNAVFDVCGRIFDIRLEVDADVTTWHEDVSFYWLYNSDGRKCAGLYMDLFTRKNKRGGAWMDVCRSRRVLKDGVQLPIAYLNCNFSPPSDGHPSLLTHNDVQTLFHEFGHCLHHMLTEVDWPQISGIANVEWDAVELPSQLLENWSWEEDLLDGYARHYQTGEHLPETLKARLLRSRYFQKAMQMARQLEYAMCDLRLHLHYEPDFPANPLDVIKQVRDEFSVTPTPEWNRFLHGFAHIFGGGYSAGYYSYLWAEQLSADVWERFEEEGPFNGQTGKDLRKEIYAVGASRPAMSSFKAFRGREPRPGPLLRSYGLE